MWTPQQCKRGAERPPPNATHLDGPFHVRAAKRAVDDGNQEACAWLLQGAISHFENDPTFWKDQVFFPCLEVLKQANAYYWIQGTWHKLGEDSLLADLTKAQTSTLLDAMVDIPQINYEVEKILEFIATKHHKLLLNWLGQRIKKAANISSMDYSPVPFAFHDVHKVLQPHTVDIIAAIREWRDSDDEISSWEISHFLSRIYPNFDGALPSTLLVMAKEGDGDDLEFIASSLEGFKGRKKLLPVLREILASEAVTEEIENIITHVIRETGVTSGEFGHAQAYQAKADMLRPWLDDSNEQVSAFAKREIHIFEQEVAAENRRAQEQIAMRKLDHDEPLDDGKPPDDDEPPKDDEPPDDDER